MFPVTNKHVLVVLALALVAVAEPRVQDDDYWRQFHAKGDREWSQSSANMDCQWRGGAVSQTDRSQLQQMRERSRDQRSPTKTVPITRPSIAYGEVL